MTQWHEMSTLDILKMFPKATYDAIEGTDFDDDLYEALYSHWQSEMPYGTQKARDGDPGEWIFDRLMSFYENRGRHWDTYKFFVQLPRLARAG